ncbi:MAG: hypothetical protein ABJA49_02050, partial [Betaproteobacteria bacterium]
MNPTINNLFAEWRTLEAPAMLAAGEPDYTPATMALRAQDVLRWQARLDAVDATTLPVEDQVDLQLIRAETRGWLFNQQVLQPWSRDPAFYRSLWTEQSDVPDHEGPTHQAAIELWQYDSPLSSADTARLASELLGIPPLLTQARSNLTGNAGDLWRAGIPTLEEQVQDLAQLARATATANAVADAGSSALAQAIDAARQATVAFVEWLHQQAPTKTGSSGIGKENYSRYVREVHLVSLDWAAEETLLKRELARAHASLRLEEHRNRDLPPLQAIATEQEYAERMDTSVRKYMDFLRERQILP